MKFSIFRTKKDYDRITLRNVECDQVIEMIKADSVDKPVGKYRDVFLALDKPENWSGYKNLSHVCPVSTFSRSKDGDTFWKAYNGVSIIEVRGLSNYLELQKAKKQAAMFPQVIAAFVGADGCSVIVLTKATLPDGTLPAKEEEALLFATKAYMMSVQCIQPSIEFRVEIKAPALDTFFLRTVDPEPYYNPSAQAFILEQPTKTSLQSGLSLTKGVIGLGDANGRVNTLGEMAVGPGMYATYTKVFNAAYHRALDGRDFSDAKDDDKLIVRAAEECCFVGLPQEETTVRIHNHMHEHEIEDIRATVQNVYIKYTDDEGQYSPFAKHQIVAYKLREFLARRYDIRFNEVLQITEFRERQSLQFMYRELGRRELNSIHHEALLEGIEPTFGEVDELVHSTHVPLYNPIEEYMEKLPKWDGKDHIKAMAEMVPTDNPYWTRLFRQWFLSMVAHWMNGDETHANSTAPILIGAQGYRKSTFCRMVLPPEMQMFYTDSIDFRTNIEAERTLSRFMLVNIDEFDQLSEKQFAFVKHLFQKPTSNIRRMYSETIASQRRYASFIATTNSEEVLRDPTGNRRYLCVLVTDKIDTEAKINHAQLYSQALHLINNGERYWINDEDEKLIRETNSRFEVQQPLEQLFLAAFEPKEKTTTENGTWMRSVEIMDVLAKMPAYNRKSDNNLYKLGKILTKLQLQKRRMADGCQYLVRTRQ